MNFLEAAEHCGYDVQGGFIASESHPLYARYRKWILPEPFSPEAFLEKTARATVVFSTDAVHGCFGWKLAEYLSMGKAIISTPVANTLEVPLEHGFRIHVIRAAPDLVPALQRIGIDERYRDKLERNAADYFDNYASPSAVIQRLTGPE